MLARRVRSASALRWAGAALALALLAHGASARPHAGTAAVPPVPREPEIAILCYHDLSSDPAAPLQSIPPDSLREQIRLLKAQGWTFLPLSVVLAHRDDPGLLPPRVAVVTFDDGYASFADDALPILRAEGVRATLALITSYVDHAHPPDLGRLLGWEQVREIDARGDAEIASHSNALHQYEPSNPYGDTGPAVGVRRYRRDVNRYEDREEYRSRVGDDLRESQRLLTAHLGHAVPVLVWPYGIHDTMARNAAAHAGFEVSLALAGRAVTAADLRAGCLPRILVTRRTDFRSGAWLHPPEVPVRAAEVDLDALWDPDESVFRARLDRAVAAVRASGANTVILPAAPGPGTDEHPRRLYAMNHQAPVFADVWSMVAAKFAAYRLRTWVRTPTLALEWAWAAHPDWRLQTGPATAAARWPHRLSPDLPGTRGAVADFLTDLAVYLPIDGVVFDDDATVLAGEKLAGEPGANAERRAAAIRGCIDAAEEAVRAWRPECRFARCIGPTAVRRTGVDAASSQGLAECLAHDALTVVDPRAARDGAAIVSARDAEALSRRIAAAWGDRAGAGAPRAFAPVLLMLPAWDARARAWIPPSRQRELADAARRGGAIQLGIAPVGGDGTLADGLLDGGAPPAAEPATPRGY